MPRTRLSELESFVLGLVWRHGPCAPYEIRRLLAESPSTQWSASAGSIYPLAARLERAGFLTGRAKKTGKRARREYALTPKGLRALRAWIGPPLGSHAATVTHDPLRSRARFLGALTPAQRRAWRRDALAALDQVEAKVRRWHEKHAAADAGARPSKPARTPTRAGARAADPYAALISLHAELDLAFRRAWLARFPRA